MNVYLLQLKYKIASKTQIIEEKLERLLVSSLSDFACKSFRNKSFCFNIAGNSFCCLLAELLKPIKYIFLQKRHLRLEFHQMRYFLSSILWICFLNYNFTVLLVLKIKKGAQYMIQFEFIFLIVAVDT